MLEDKITLGFIPLNGDSVEDNNGDCVNNVCSGIVISCGGTDVVEYGCGVIGVKGGSKGVSKG